MFAIVEGAVMALFGLGFGLICVECAELLLDELRKKDMKKLDQKEFARRCRERIDANKK